MNIEKDDIINALKVLATMLKHAKLSSHDVAELMIKELEFVDFVPATPIKEQFNEVVKFDKSFESLYNISMCMADNCIVNKPLEKRMEKLDEEFREVIEAFASYHKSEGESELMIKSKKLALQNELSDLLFVLLHIGHKLDINAFELLHRASSKMLSRMNDSTYQAKN